MSYYYWNDVMRQYFKLLRWFSKNNPYQFIFSGNLINLDEFNKIKELAWNTRYKRVMFWVNSFMGAVHAIVMLFAVYNIELYAVLFRGCLVLVHCVAIMLDYKTELYNIMLGYYTGIENKNTYLLVSQTELTYQSEVDIILSTTNIFVGSGIFKGKIIGEDDFKSIYCLNTDRARN